jgi:hypothetical protein
MPPKRDHTVEDAKLLPFMVFSFYHLMSSIYAEKCDWKVHGHRGRRTFLLQSTGRLVAANPHDE